MNSNSNECACGSSDHVNRRTLLKAAGLSAASWLTPVAEILAQDAERKPLRGPAKSVIVLWMHGGPSQLDTFDPHPGSKIGGLVRDRETAVKGLRIASGLEQMADQMDSVSLVRSVVSKEGDHERATYTVKTGYRPDPTMIHPSLGAVVCHQTENNIEIPRHVSILNTPWPARGGYLGDQYDAFKINDPVQPIPDVKPRVSAERFQKRLRHLDVIEAEFARGRLSDLDAKKTLHTTSIEAARKMMASDQLAAFDVKQAPESLRQEFGETPFGRGCLTAVRLIEAGVRCVEVSLGNWDSHINNDEFQAELVGTLDPAFAALIRELKNRNLLDSTLVLWGGEFGRTPRINGAGGRDHWPHGFSVALAGGGIAGGRVIGETSPDPKLDKANPTADTSDPRDIADIHATIFSLLGIDFTEEIWTPIGRPMAISKGKVIEELMA